MSLENTTWMIQSTVIMTCEFKANNVATMKMLNGQSFNVNWDASGGAFAIEWPKSTADPNKWIVSAGTYSGDKGSGVKFYFGVGAPENFTMVKTS